MNASKLFAAMIFGSIGLGFFIYGKKQKAVMPLLSGIDLMVFPYFITNIHLMLLTGVALAAAPFIIKI